MEIIEVDRIPETSRNTSKFLEFRDYIYTAIEEGRREVKVRLEGVHYTTVKNWIHKLTLEDKKLAAIVVVRHKVPYVSVKVKG